MRVFKTLMVTRGTLLSPAHVEALNTIDLEFNGSQEEDKQVREAWKAYLDYLNQKPGDLSTPEAQKRWGEKVEELLADLLHVMSKAVGYDFDKTHIKRAAYSPQRYGNLEQEQDFIRRSTVELFLGQKTIPIEVRPSPRPANGGESSEEHLRRLLIEHYEGGKPVKVMVVTEPEVESKTTNKPPTTPPPQQ